MQINYEYRIQKHVSISYKSFLLHYKVIQIKHINHYFNQCLPLVIPMTFSF